MLSAHNPPVSHSESKGNSFLPTLEEIQKLNDIEQIEILLKDTKQRELTLNEELDDAVKASEKVESNLELFEVIPVRFQTIYKESKTLEHTISVACKIAETVSKKVRDLDTVRARIKETTKKVADIIDVKNCLEGVKKSMETEDYEAAAAHIQRYLNIDASVLEENSLKQLKEAEQKLKDIFNKKLDEAIKSNNEQEIVRFCWLYTPLGLRDEGLTRYSHYLRNLCSAEAESLHKVLLRSLGRSYNAQPEDEKPVTVTDTTTKLFEFIAAMIEDQTPIVNEKFGPGSMVTVIKNLQLQSDIHATKILDLFFEHYHIQKTVEEVTSSKKRAMESYGTQTQFQQTDPRQLSFLLDEIVSLSQSAELYDRFIRSKSKSAMELGKSSPESPKEVVHNSNNTIKKKPADGLLHVSELNRKMQELIGQYILLEEYYMSESVHKAFRMDEPLEDSHTSSIVDHVFFVFQQCTHRALLSTNINAICAIVNIVVNVLSKDYLEVLQRSLQDQLSRSLSTTAALLRTNPTDYKVNVNTMLNNLEVSSEYILKLKKEMEGQCQDKIFGTLDVKLKSCFDEMQEATNSFKRVLQGFLEQISASLIPRLRPAMDSFALVTYELTEVEFSDREVNDPFVQQFISLLDSILLPYKTALTSSNYDNLVHSILKYVVQKLEGDLLRKRFNQLGGLQLDKEIRVLQSYFSTLTQKTVRDKFARLTQMAALLYLEKAKEAEEYWGQNATYMTWRLTPGEVRRVLGLRIDFTKDSIAKLKLN